MNKVSKAVAIAAALGILFAATPVSASTTHYITRTNGNAASADWQSVNGDITTDSYVEVDQTKAGTDVFVSLCTYNEATEEGSCQAGYSPAANNVFTVNKLNSAALSPVQVQLYDDYGYGNPTSVVTVQASWTGSGKTQKGRFQYKQSFGGFTEITDGQSTLRNASASGSIDGTDLGPSSYGELVQFRTLDLLKIK